MHMCFKQVLLLHSKLQRFFTLAFSTCIPSSQRTMSWNLSANLLTRAVRSSTYSINACDCQGAFVVPGQGGTAKQLQLELKFLLNYHGLSSADFEVDGAAAVDAFGAILPYDSIMKWLSSMNLC